MTDSSHDRSHARRWVPPLVLGGFLLVVAAVLFWPGDSGGKNDRPSDNHDPRTRDPHGIDPHAFIGHGGSGSEPWRNIKVEKLEPPENGRSIAELEKDKKKFDGKPVLVKCTIITHQPRLKFIASPSEPYVHRYRANDGSVDDHNTFWFTCEEQFAPGDVVVVTGNLATDKVFFRKQYSLIIHKAVVRLEKAAKEDSAKTP